MRSRGIVRVALSPAILIGTATGCGDSGTAASKGAPPEVWASRICTAVVHSEVPLKKRAIRYLTRYKNANTAADARASLLLLFRQAGKAAAAELNEIQALGPPAVEQGEEIQGIVEDVWRQAGAVFERAEVRGRRLPIDNRAVLASGFKALDKRFGNEMEGIDPTITKLENYQVDRLNKAVRDDPDCRSPMFRGTAGPAPDVASLVRGFVTGEL
jgi:hypothetical protein